MCMSRGLKEAELEMYPVISERLLLWIIHVVYSDKCALLKTPECVSGVKSSE